MRNRGVVGALECVTCFERSCFGCALTAAPIGVCSICGRDIRLGDEYGWSGLYPIHFECIEEKEEND